MIPIMIPVRARFGRNRRLTYRQPGAVRLDRTGRVLNPIMPNTRLSPHPDVRG